MLGGADGALIAPASALPAALVAQHLTKRALRREISAHSVYAHPWRCRRRAEIQTADRRRVGPPRRTREQLPQIGDTAAEVATHEIRVVPLEIARPHH